MLSLTGEKQSRNKVSSCDSTFLGWSLSSYLDDGVAQLVEHEEVLGVRGSSPLAVSKFPQCPHVAQSVRAAG